MEDVESKSNRAKLEGNGEEDIMNKKIIASVFLMTILFVSAIVGTLTYYNGVVNKKNSEIVLLNNQIENLNNEVSNLSAQVANLTSLSGVSIQTYLGVKDLDGSGYYFLDIAGSVLNVGDSTAFHPGLHVVAYDAQGTLEINMTVGLAKDTVFSTDNRTRTFVQMNVSLYDPSFVDPLYSNETAPIALNIYHEGMVTNWTVTPVWTNTP
jgi:outer membrane murein-binding lipoprotein Lpp